MSTLIASGTVQDNLLNTQKAAIPTLTGNEGLNQNLIVRSTTNNVKGAVVFDENTPSYGLNNGAVQLAGGLSSQHNVTAGGVFLHSPFGYTVNNVVMFQQGSYGTVATITAGGQTFSFPTFPSVTLVTRKCLVGKLLKVMLLCNQTLLYR